MCTQSTYDTRNSHYRNTRLWIFPFFKPSLTGTRLKYLHCCRQQYLRRELFSPYCVKCKVSTGNISSDHFSFSTVLMAARDMLMLMLRGQYRQYCPETLMTHLLRPMHKVNGKYLTQSKAGLEHEHLGDKPWKNFNETKTKMWRSEGKYQELIDLKFSVNWKLKLLMS